MFCVYVFSYFPKPQDDKIQKPTFFHPIVLHASSSLRLNKKKTAKRRKITYRDIKKPSHTQHTTKTLKR